MGVQWHTSLVGEQCGDSVRMVNIDTFGTKLSNPLESAEDKAEEDNLLENLTIEVYPDSKIEGGELHNQCFLTQWRDMAKFSFNHSIRKASELTAYIWKWIPTRRSECSPVALLGVIFWGR